MKIDTRARILAAVLAAAGAAPGAVRACGVCIEDRVAATYDHAVIQRAIEKRQQVVFVALDGRLRADDVARKLATARVPGVVAGTLRTSAAPAAFSFVLDARETPVRAVTAFRSAVGDPHVRLTLVRIVRDGKLIEPR